MFTSHDANLVVNGDAELVLHCDYLTEVDRKEGPLCRAHSIPLTCAMR